MSKNHSLNNYFITRNALFEIISIRLPVIIEKFLTITKLLSDKNFKNINFVSNNNIMVELYNLFNEVSLNQFIVIFNQFLIKQTNLFFELYYSNNDDEFLIIDFLNKSYENLRHSIENNDLFLHITDDNKKKKLEFILLQFLNSIEPRNFLLTNSDAISSAIETNGASIIDGLDNLIFDIKKSDDIFKISTVNSDFFEIGKNIATTAGNIVYKNELIELIHYKPITENQHEIPLLIVPPCINKFYILDLQQQNSYIKWALEQGLNVFLISWKNPTSKQDIDISFEDYINKGILSTVDYISGYFPKINCLGYCVGGTLLACAVAYLEQIEKSIINNITLLTTLLDYKEVGDISVFTSNYNTENSINDFYKGDEMYYAFSLLKSKEMIWSFYIQNYLLGKKPKDFDILHWNNDSTNLPRKMHNFYIKNFYQKNLLTEKQLVINNIMIDLSKITIPCYILACKDDHIAPWNSVFEGNNLLKSKIVFVLAGSGHIGGVINHPERNKHCYWTNNKKHDLASDWFENATHNNGSWWPHWMKWMVKNSGKITKIKPINEMLGYAPGEYVR
jgi:polyhydroxyalkanoate synthase subunit PhaC